MKNILLILENPLEFDLTKTVLQRLGFNVIWIQKGLDMNEHLQKNFPDLVITSVLGQKDEFLDEFLRIRTKRGTPQFIWVGPKSRLNSLKESQRKLIDSNMQPPIQPDLLITSVCKLFDLNAQEYIANYRAMITGSVRVEDKASVHPMTKGSSAAKLAPKSEVIMIKDPVRAQKYEKFLEKVEKQDKVFTVRDLLKRTRLEGSGGNTSELFEKKKSFIKALFKK